MPFFPLDISEPEPWSWEPNFYIIIILVFMGPVWLTRGESREKPLH